MAGMSSRTPADVVVWWRHFYSLCALLGVFFVATGAIYGMALCLSSRISKGAGTEVGIYFPTSLEELKSLADKLQGFKEDHFYIIIGFFSAAYLYKQSFAIPGSFFLNILAGALFGLWLGLFLVCVLSACGASCCYLLSCMFGRDLVHVYLSRHINPLQAKLNKNRGSLIFLLISLRLLPMTPNWLLNIVSPLLGVPLHLFFLSVLLGLLPYNLLCIQTGLVLAELQSLSMLDTRSVIPMFLAVVALLATALLLKTCQKLSLNN